jgi:glyceraldehyde-3-phosphate dehydrogenase/erythrose-4-phosphate dehydrogenase
MSGRVAIGGLPARAAAERSGARGDDADIELAAVNDLAQISTLIHLLAHDSAFDRYASIFDTGLTSVLDRTRLKVGGSYGNDRGYSSRRLKLAQRVMMPVAA